MNEVMRSNQRAYAVQEAILQELPDDLIEIDVRHHFGGGVYIREALIPAGSMMVGKMHRTETMNFLVSGTLRMVTAEGTRDITGPYIFTSPGMNKKAAVSLTDAVFLTIHPSEEKDPDEIVDTFTVPEAEAVEFMRLLEDES